MTFIRLAALAAVVTLVPATSHGAPVLSGVQPSAWTIAVTDGTSNTIAFGESTRLEVCLPTSAVPGNISDGSSNTLLLSEAAGVVVSWTGRRIADGNSNTIVLGERLCLDGIVNPQPVLGNITDGSSNTVRVGEVIDLRGVHFDVCFSQVRVGSFTDGSSNTIAVGELTSPCYRGVRVGDDLSVQVPAPSLLAVVLLGLGGAAARRRRRPAH